MLNTSLTNFSALPRREKRSYGNRRVTRTYRQRELWENANTGFRASRFAPATLLDQHKSFREQLSHQSGRSERRMDAPSSKTPPVASPEASEETWLEDTLVELAACPDHAADEGLEAPSELGLARAKLLLEDVSSHVRDRPEVYPMDEGGIAIDFRNSQSRSGVLFLIERNGSGVFYTRTPKSKGRLRVDDARDLLDEGGLRELGRVGIH